MVVGQMIDIHCHILHSIDDGPADLEGSLLMAKTLSDLGFTKAIATPHRPWEGADPDFKKANEQFVELSEAIPKAGIELQLFLAAEHFGPYVLELLQQDKIAYYPRGDSFLMEFPLTGFPPRVEDIFFRCQLKAKIPVIAHVERYPEVQQDYKCLEGMKKRGCKILVNLSSLVGGWDAQSKQVARKIIESNLADAVTSDLHSALQLEVLSNGLKELKAIVGDGNEFQRLTKEGPAGVAGL